MVICEVKWMSITNRGKLLEYLWICRFIGKDTSSAADAREVH